MDRSKLATLAAIIGTVTIGGVTVRAWQSLPDTATADLADAGVMSCPTRLVTCNWRIDPDGAFVLADAGVFVPTGYKTLAARVKVCVDADGGRDVVFPPLPQRAGQLAALATPDLHNCTIAADPGGALWRPAPSACVRKPGDGGTCTRLDGGDPGEFNAQPRAELTGAGCEDTACTVYAGETP